MLEKLDGTNTSLFDAFVSYKEKNYEKGPRDYIHNSSFS
jgi:hypothetical protein